MENVNRKLTNAVLYLLRGCAARPGVTAVLKLLFFADYWHYKKHLRSITGEKYVAMERGPVLNEYKAVFDAMERAKLIGIKDVPVEGQPKPKKEFHAISGPDETVFTRSELAVLDRVIAELSALSGTELSDLSHQEPAWIFGWHQRPDEEIPYSTFRWMENLPTEEEQEIAKQSLKDAGLLDRIRQLNQQVAA